jgi:hypothetical protein
VKIPYIISTSESLDDVRVSASAPMRQIRRVEEERIELARV